MKNKKNDKKTEMVYEEWLYMNSKEITVVDINEVVKDIVEIDLWDELGVISLKLDDKAYIDIEEIETDLGNDEENKFVSDNNIKSICQVKLPKQYIKGAEEKMKLIIKGIGGFFVKDNGNFDIIIK